MLYAPQTAQHASVDKKKTLERRSPKSQQTVGGGFNSQPRTLRDFGLLPSWQPLIRGVSWKADSRDIYLLNSAVGGN